MAQLLGDVERMSGHARRHTPKLGLGQRSAPRGGAAVKSGPRRRRTLVGGVLVLLVGVGAAIIALGSSGKASGRVFASPNVPVTFTYPSNWSAPHTDASGYLQVGIDPSNGIFVTQGETNYRLKGAYAVANLTRSSATHGGVTMKVVNFALPGAGNVHQRNYVFTGFGSKWQVSCYWEPADRALIEPACAKAISSAKISP